MEAIQEQKTEVKEDMLTKIVAMQKSIMDRFYNLENMSIEEKERRTEKFMLAAFAELGEVLNGDDIRGIKGEGALRWKDWKTNQPPTNPDYIKKELIDVMLFTVEMLILWGANDKEIFERYMSKVDENHKRYSNGY
jgi:NTP pyrophosphatase (non-canonical NTP hydrolase)